MIYPLTSPYSRSNSVTVVINGASQVLQIEQTNQRLHSVRYSVTLTRGISFNQLMPNIHIHHTYKKFILVIKSTILLRQRLDSVATSRLEIERFFFVRSQQWLSNDRIIQQRKYEKNYYEDCTSVNTFATRHGATEDCIYILFGHGQVLTRLREVEVDCGFLLLKRRFLIKGSRSQSPPHCIHI